MKRSRSKDQKQLALQSSSLQTTPNYFVSPFDAALIRAKQDALAHHAALTENRNSADIMSWVPKNRWIQGQPWSFNSVVGLLDLGERDVVPKTMPRPYIYDYLRDTSLEKSAIKPRQAEWSESTINEILFTCLNTPGVAISHVFPTDKLADSFSEEKIRTAILESPLIYRLTEKSATRRYRFAGNSFYTPVGALAKGAGRAGSRDIIAFDELDLIPDSAIGIFFKMLSHSKIKRVIKLSTPTVPDIGIDKVVKHGSMNEWIVKCPECGRHQILTFPDNLINFFEASRLDTLKDDYDKHLRKIYIGCKHCKAYIDRCSPHYVGTSKWNPTRKELIGINSSYSLSALMLPWKTGVEIARECHNLSSYIWQFYNEVLGIAFIRGSSRLKLEDILVLQREWSMPLNRTASMQRVSIGVDYGVEISWAVISCSGYDSVDPTARCIVYAERIDDRLCHRKGINDTGPVAHAKRVVQLSQAFRADIVINDCNGVGASANKELLKQLPGRVWGALFDTHEAGSQLKDTKLLRPRYKQEQRQVTFSKLLLVREIQTEIREQRLLLPKITGEDALPLEDFAKHHTNLGVQPRWSVEAEREYDVVVKFNDDHYFDADMYSRIGWEKLGGEKKGGAGVIAPRGHPGLPGLFPPRA